MGDFPNFQDRPSWPGIVRILVVDRSSANADLTLAKRVGAAALFDGAARPIVLDGVPRMTVDYESTRFHGSCETTLKFRTRESIGDECVIVEDVNGGLYAVNWHPELSGKLERNDSLDGPGDADAVREYTLTVPTEPMECLF